MNKSMAWLNEAAKSSTDDCLLYPFNPSQRYGLVRTGGKAYLAHRMVLELAGRPPIPGTEARHLCGAARCCNPRHLCWSTHSENEADKKRHGTLRRMAGEENHRRKLTAEDVALIRSSTETKALAERFNVNPSTIRRVRRGETYPS